MSNRYMFKYSSLFFIGIFFGIVLHAFFVLFFEAIDLEAEVIYFHGEVIVV